MASTAGSAHAGLRCQRALHPHRTPSHRLPLNSNDELQRDVIGPQLSLLLNHGSEVTSQGDGINFGIDSGRRWLHLFLSLSRGLYRGGIRSLSTALHRGGSYPRHAALRLGGIRSFRAALCRRGQGSVGRPLPATNRERSEIIARFQLLPPLGLIEKRISGLLRPKTAGYP